jgi:hypothetical protein
VTRRFFRGDRTVFRGEYWSFHSLITSCDQNASRLGLRGGVGIRSGRPLEGETSLNLKGLGGGVDGLRGGVNGCVVKALCGEMRLGGSLMYCQYRRDIASTSAYYVSKAA